jgi:hypothetical protein
MEIQLKLNLPGGRRYEKVSYPARYGHLAEIKTLGHCFQLNLNGEIKYLKGLGEDWPHPSEWLKRTLGNHWVYYDSGGYNRIFDYLGEYYLPCFTYESNSLWEPEPFKAAAVQGALAAFQRLPMTLKQGLEQKTWPAEEREFLLKTITMDSRALAQRARRLLDLLQEKITVLPPDTRHVDYDCLPLMIADGCLYHCRFCRVKSPRDFHPRSPQNILRQIKGIKALYGPGLKNFNSLFLGQHDALNCGKEIIVYAALSAYELWEFERSHLEGSFLFLFGSVDSFLRAGEGLFEALNRLPFRTYLNLGLESADQPSLDMIGKPLTAGMVEEAFRRLTEINRDYDRLEVTANFLVDMELPAGHWESLSRLVGHHLPHYFDKGAVYLSPLSSRDRKGLLQRIRELKMKSRLPLYLYLLQRL